MTKLILIAGMSRGGTNLLWNIIQSHPKVIDSYFELNEIFGSKTKITLLEKAKIEASSLIKGMPINNSTLIQNRINKYAWYSFTNDPFNKFKKPDIQYKDTEFSDLIIATKLVSSWETDYFRKILKRNDALKYLPQMETAYPSMKVVFLVRNGLAVAEGWGRRGASIEASAHWYRKYLLFYQSYVNANPNHAMIMRFEDLLIDPFESAFNVCDFLSLSSESNMALRIAIKPTIRSNHTVVNTTDKTKLWINKDNFSEFLDVGINDAQIKKLEKNKQNYFIQKNKDLLEKYQYL